MHPGEVLFLQHQAFPSEGLTSAFTVTSSKLRLQWKKFWIWHGPVAHWSPSSLFQVQHSRALCKALEYLRRQAERLLVSCSCSPP